MPTTATKWCEVCGSKPAWYMKATRCGDCLQAERMARIEAARAGKGAKR